MKHVFLSFTVLFIIQQFLGNFYGYPIQLLGDPLQYNVLGRARIMVGVVSDGVEWGGEEGRRPSWGRLACELCRVPPII